MNVVVFGLIVILLLLIGIGMTFMAEPYYGGVLVFVVCFALLVVYAIGSD